MTARDFLRIFFAKSPAAAAARFEVRDAFLQIDKDRSGTITINEYLSPAMLGMVGW